MFLLTTATLCVKVTDALSTAGGQKYYDQQISLSCYVNSNTHTQRDIVIYEYVQSRRYDCSMHRNDSSCGSMCDR